MTCLTDKNQTAWLCRPTGGWGPWRLVLRVEPNLKESDVLPKCCCCYTPAHDTAMRVYHEKNPYYSSWNEFRCMPGRGCRKNPKKRLGYHLREYRFEDGGGSGFFER